MNPTRVTRIMDDIRQLLEANNYEFNEFAAALRILLKLHEEVLDEHRQGLHKGMDCEICDLPEA